MLSLERLPLDILFDLAALLNLADLASLIHVLPGNHRQVLIDKFKTRFLSALDLSSFAATAFLHPYREIVSFLPVVSRTRDTGPIELQMDPPEDFDPTVNVPFLLDTARLTLTMGYLDPQDRWIVFAARRMQSDPTYESNIIESDKSTGRKLY